MIISEERERERERESERVREREKERESVRERKREREKERESVRERKRERECKRGELKWFELTFTFSFIKVMLTMISTDSCQTIRQKSPIVFDKGPEHTCPTHKKEKRKQSHLQVARSSHAVIFLYSDLETQLDFLSGWI